MSYVSNASHVSCQPNQNEQVILCENDMTTTNTHGRRIGEDHPRATITDHDVAAIFVLLDERDAALERWKTAGLDAWRIDNALTLTGLSYRLIADRFDIDKSTVFKIASGARRSQTTE